MLELFFQNFQRTKPECFLVTSGWCKLVSFLLRFEYKIVYVCFWKKNLILEIEIKFLKLKEQTLSSGFNRNSKWSMPIVISLKGHVSMAYVIFTNGIGNSL
jgi:hypothetical protein